MEECDFYLLNILILCLQESAPKKAVAKSANAEELTTDDLSALREAIDALSQEKGQSFIGEHDVLSDIKQELVDYEEDLGELKDITESTGRKQLQQTKGAARLFKKVEPALTISFDDISLCNYRIIFKISLKYRFR